MNSGTENTDRNSIGKYGEEIAAKFLESKGFEILVRNYRCRTGEIDIIAKAGEYLSFAEVKLRKNSRFGEAREFVTAKKQKKIISAAKFYMLQKEKEILRIFGKEPQERFDVVEIYLPGGMGEKAYVRLIEDAFPAE